MNLLRWMKINPCQPIFKMVNLIHANLMVDMPSLLNFEGTLVSALQVPPFFICNFRSFVEFSPGNHLTHFRWFVRLVDKFLRILPSHSGSFEFQACISKIMI